jgi:hypothetical protein
VNLLTNPMVLRMALLMFAAMVAFGLGLFAMRRLRKSLLSETDSLNYDHAPLAAEGLPVHAYHAVIQQLKQQKHELATQQLAERRKAKASDTLSSTILSNLQLLYRNQLSTKRSPPLWQESQSSAGWCSITLPAMDPATFSN